MKKQNLIKQTLSQLASIEYVKELLESKQIPNRAKLSEKVCEHFDFVDTRGYQQKSSCLTALCELEAVGHFILPEPTKRNDGKNFSLHRLPGPVPEPLAVPVKAGAIEGLKLVIVETDEQKRIWNELMFCEHPRGSTLFVGRQLKYLIDSDYGWLGGIGFAASALHLADGVDSDNWAENEFGGAPLGDKRLSERLVNIATAKSNTPSASIGEVLKGDKAAIKGYYRMIERPDESAFTMENVLLPHREMTIRRMQGQRTALCIQDTSVLNYTHLEDCEGLDQITGSNQTGAVPKGLFLHSTIVVDSNGLPLGVLKSRTISPAKKSKDDKRLPRDIPVEEKKTFTWIEHHRDMVAVAAAMPNTRLINICDREGDFFELFDEQRRNPRVELLIRASHDRRLAPGRKLFSEIRALPVQNVISLYVPRKSARPKKSRQKASPARKERNTELEIRYMSFQIRSPEHGLLSDLDPVDLWIVHALEKNPPEGNKAIEWFLLTTIKINNTSDAEECLRWYSKRWHIEEWHRVLKSGCRIEKLANKTADRLRRAIAINLVIAWRIMLMKQMYRKTPELPAKVLFSDTEILTLKAYAKKKGYPSPDTVGAAIFIVAKFGGYLARKSDPPPGDQILWRGYTTLQIMAAGFELMMELMNDEG